jgi:hypothetical protein
MSVINFKCAPDKKEFVKNTCWEIIRAHYFDTVYPNTNVEYKNEGKEVYLERLNELMKTELCKTEETEDGLRFEFDSTEDAGFSIAMGVYGTGMGYSDNGLTFLRNIFKNLMTEMPEILFEAECECSDNWVCEEYTITYDGDCLSGDAEWLEYEE